MYKCKNCGVEYEARRSTSEYCSSKCRKLAFQAREGKVSVPHCKYCGVELEHPKQVCCGPCAWKRDGTARTERRPLFQMQPPKFTGKLTDFEREHYKPASELKVGEHNPVSKPGDEHYAVSVPLNG